MVIFHSYVNVYPRVSKKLKVQVTCGSYPRVINTPLKHKGYQLQAHSKGYNML